MIVPETTVEEVVVTVIIVPEAIYPDTVINGGRDTPDKLGADTAIHTA